MEPVSIRSYRALYESIKEPTLYAAPWWLDATCGIGGWDALIRYGAEMEPRAGFPFHSGAIRGLSAVTTPPLTQWVSLLLNENVPMQEKSVSLTDLPKTSILDLTFKPDDLIQFQDFSSAPTLKYSFIIPFSEDIALIRTGYNEGLRRNLKQAVNIHTIEPSDDIMGFLGLCRQTYLDRNVKPPSWMNSVIPAVYKSLLSHHCGMLSVTKVSGKIIAGILTAWDSHSTYYLAGGKKADEQGTSAHALLLDQAIREAMERRTLFDFEGSMHPGIANFFQSFGATPTAYWHFRRYSGMGRLWALLKN